MLLLIVSNTVAPVSAQTFTSEATGYQVSVVVGKDESGENTPIQIEPTDPEYHRLVNMIEPQFNIAAFSDAQGNYGFCIEPHQRFSNDTFNIQGWDYRSPWIDSLETFEKVNLIAFHGFLKDRQYLEDWQYWYAVTYQIIYDEVLAVAAHNIDNYETNKQIILGEVARHDLLPSFNNESVKLIEETVQALTDTHQVMGDMRLIDDGGFDVRIENETLIVKARADSPDQGRIKLMKYADSTNRDPVVYTNPKTQDVFVPGLPSPIPMELTVERVQPNTISIVKVDEQQQPISGTIFHLSKSKDFSEVIELVTDGQGNTEILEIFGDQETLYIKEVFVPQPYILSKEIKEIILSSGHNHQIQFVNRKTQGKITLLKVDHQNKPLSDVEFELYDAQDSLVDTLVTNAEGYAYSSLLPLGQYYLLETKGPKGYVSEQKRYEVSIEYEEVEVVEVYKTITNQPIQGSLKIHKFGSMLVDLKPTSMYGYEVFQPVFENRYLAGATFELRAAEDLRRHHEVLYEKGAVVATFTTSDKVVELTELPLGRYHLIETKAPQGYVLDPQVHEIEIVATNESQELVIKELSLENQRLSGVLKAQKSFESSAFLKDPSELQKQTIFGLYLKEPLKLEQLTIEAGTLMAVNQLNGNNELHLPVHVEGVYQLVELESPMSYQRLKEPIEVQIEFGSEPMTIIELEPELNNVLKRGQVVLLKLDYDQPETVLAGTRFDLYRVMDQEHKIGTYTTNQDGKIELELEFGDYYFVESKALSGYLNNEEKLFFKINGDTSPIHLTSYNQQTVTRFSKLDEQTHEFVERAVLQVFDDQNQLIEQWISTKQPHTIHGLHRNRTYTLVEKNPPQGYQTIPEQEFELDSNQLVTEVVLYNTQLDIEIKVLKVDGDTNQPLKDAHFELMDADNQVLMELITDNQGQVSYIVKPGTYYLKEIQAPYGYRIDPEIRTIEVTGLEVDQSLQVIFTNGKVYLPRTGPASTYIAIGIFALGTSIIGYLLLRFRP